ncbi:integrase, catalytic region, zinc finger, CCHC-type containing protein [Tanacetum coccineum]
MMRLSGKNLLIANDNLIADCLPKEVFYIAMNSELTISRFTEMHDAHTIVQARCLELEAKLSKLHDKVKKDDHTELVKHFSNLEVNHLNLQLKYQNLKERFGNNTSLPTRDVPDFDSVFVIGKMKASIQGKDNAIKKLRMQISQLKETRSEANRTLDFRALDFQITQLTEKVTVLQKQNELFRAENEKVKQHYKELYDSIKIMRAKHIEQTTTLLTENENLKAQKHENLKCITMDSVDPYDAIAINYVVVSNALDVSPSVIAAGVAADNVISTALAVSFAICKGATHVPLSSSEQIALETSKIAPETTPGPGTASVVLLGLILALKLVGRSLANHKFLFLGAGEVSLIKSHFGASAGAKQTRIIQLMHTTMVPVQVNTLKIQAGVQVSRPGELRRHLQLWKRFGRLYLCCICT